MKDEILKRYKEDNGFIGKNDFKIIDLNENTSKLEYIIKEDGLNPAKIVHGGILFGLCDTAAGVLACMNGKFPLTISANINYLKPAKGKKLTAIANKLKEGKTIGYYNVNVYNDLNELITTCNVNMFFSELK